MVWKNVLMLVLLCGGSHVIRASRNDSINGLTIVIQCFNVCNMWVKFLITCKLIGGHRLPFCCLHRMSKASIETCNIWVSYVEYKCAKLFTEKIYWSQQHRNTGNSQTHYHSKRDSSSLHTPLQSVSVVYDRTVFSTTVGWITIDLVQIFTSVATD